MRKFWIIVKHEYTRHVLRKRFLFALLSVPLWVLISLGAGVLSVVLQTNPAPVGYVDHAGVLDGIDISTVTDDPLQTIEFRSYASEEAAKADLDLKKIQGYFSIAPDYRQTLDSQLLYYEEPSAMVRSQFADALRAGLLRDIDPRISNRLVEGADLDIQVTQEDRGMPGSEWFKIGAPIAAGIFLIVSVFTSSGYLMQAVVEEKENRTMELLATSVSPMQIMGGKIVALISVGLTQVLAWGFFPILMVLLARASVPFLRDITINWKMIGLVVITSIPTFLLVSSLMATIGATVTEAREGQQVSTLITLPVMAPFMLLSVIMMNPQGILAVVLTFFPLTAALTLLIRIAFSTVPAWQIVISEIVLVLSAVGSVWLAGRVFRIGMLRYGKRMGWKDVFQAVIPHPAVPKKETR